MSGIKVGAGQLGEALSKIIQEYSDEVVKALPDAAKKAAKDCVKTLKGSAPRRTGAYAGSFKSKQTRSSATQTEYTVYSTKPSLPHLLEFGHVMKNQYGVYGVSVARPHWAPAEEAANKALEQEIQKKVEEAG